jgi:hypothetical protein
VQYEGTQFFAEFGTSGLTGADDWNTAVSQLIYQPLHVCTFAGAIDAL